MDLFIIFVTLRRLINKEGDAVKFLTQTLVGILYLGLLTSCTINRGELGTEANPVKLFFVPSVDAKVIEDNSKIIEDFLEKNTPYKFQVSIPQNYVAVVEAFGTNKADIAALNTFGYLLAHDKYGAEARVTVIRHGSTTYQAQIIAKTDGPIKKVEDIQGKKMAFVDAASTSGYLLPMKMLKDKNVDAKETVFANKHDNVVSMIYQGQVDAGATFYSPSDEEGIQDARRLVKTQYPDVEKKISIVALSEPIPNDPIVFRKEMPEEMKTKIIDALQLMIANEEGKKAFKSIYGADSFKLATDKDYEPVRDMLRSLGKKVDEMIK